MKLKVLFEEYSHCCAMIDLPDEIASQVLKWGYDNIKEDIISKEEGYGREIKPHVTVLYGLNNSSRKKVIEIVNKFKPFTITLGKISKFSNDCDVIKFDIESEELHELNKELRKLPHESTHKEYIPHCTIAYVKTNAADEFIGTSPLKGTKFLVTELTFSMKDSGNISIQLGKNS